nr:hypothetical protein [Tanacetum cinerariifolium]
MVGSNIDGYMARFHELSRLVPHMVTPENQRANRYIRGLAPETKAHVTSSKPTIFRVLATDGIKDRIFKKQKNTGNKKRSNDQNKNQGYFTRYCMGKAINERPRPTCFECGDPNHFRRNCLSMNQDTTTKGNRSNPMLAIKGKPNTGNNRNRAQGRAFSLGVAKAPQDQNVVTSRFSLNDHFSIVLFDFSADYSFISTNLLPLITMKPSAISPGYEIEIASGLMVRNKQEKDKIGTKPDQIKKKGKRGEAWKNQEQSQWIEREKPKKTQKEWSKTQTRLKNYQEKDKIRSKPDENRKRGEAGKSQKQLQ